MVLETLNRYFFVISSNSSSNAEIKFTLIVPIVTNRTQSVSAFLIKFFLVLIGMISS